MNDAQRPEADPNDKTGRRDAHAGEPPQGPNLVLLYSLIALALAVAIAIAALIVLPFYRRN